MPNRRQPSGSPEEQSTRAEELKKEINELPDKDPKLCEGLIRELHKKILTVQKSDVKERLLTDLKKVSIRGLDGDLKQIVKENGLSLEALELVLKYLTTKNELAKYLFTNPEEVVKQDDLDMVRRRLGPSLEVLGGLNSKEIDVNQEWAKKLLEAAPSLQSLARISQDELGQLCEGAKPGEKEDVDSLVKIAVSRTRQQSGNGQVDKEKSANAEKGKNAIDKEKLEEAKALMNEAKEMAKKESEEAKKAVNEKMEEITKILQLPPDWNKQPDGSTPEQLFGQLDKIIDQFNNALEVSKPYENDLEVVKKASGGRALCGIYHSEYVAPTTAERPLIVMPAQVTLSSPNNSQQIRYVRFSESRAAANYVQTVKSSSTNIGFSVGGFYGLFVGDVHGSYAYRGDEEGVTSRKKQTNSASVLQYVWIATKTFKIEQEQFMLTKSARQMASSIMKSTNKAEQQEAARRFMERYGSHFPAGLHTLGGVLFRAVDARSQNIGETTKLTEKAVQKLQGQISVGFLGGAFGIGASISGEHSKSSGTTSAEDDQFGETSYTYSFQAMGPVATDIPTFTKLLSNNSTWAIIDRGSHHAFIPVWEIIRDLGGDFEAPAKLIEDTWCEDEKKNREKSLRVGYKITEIIRNELEMMKDEYVAKKPKDADYGHWPKNGAPMTFSFKTLELTRGEAYQKAVDIIMTDPRYRICEIAPSAGDVYNVRCWKASERVPMTFDRGDGEHVLLFSKSIFKWKDEVPS